MTQQASRDSTVLLQSIWFATHRRNLTKRSCLKFLLLNDSTSKPWPYPLTMLFSPTSQYMSHLQIRLHMCFYTSLGVSLGATATYNSQDSELLCRSHLCVCVTGMWLSQHDLLCNGLSVVLHVQPSLSSNPVVLSYQSLYVTSSYSFAYVFLHITRSITRSHCHIQFKRLRTTMS